MSLKKVVAVFGVLFVLGTSLIQAPPEPRESRVSGGGRPVKAETLSERVARVRKETASRVRALVKKGDAGKSQSMLSEMPRPSNDLAAPLLAHEGSEESVSDTARQADDLKFNQGVVDARTFHATQEADARLMSEYLQKQLELERWEKFERDDLVDVFNRDIAGNDSALSSLSVAERADLDNMLVKIHQEMTPEEEEAVKNMSPDQRQEIESFIAKVLQERNVDNAPYGNDDEKSHAKMQEDKKAQLAQERAELQKFIQQVLAEPEMTEAELQEHLQALRSYPNIHDSSKNDAAASGARNHGFVDDNSDDDGPVFTEEPDDSHSGELDHDDSIVFSEESDGSDHTVAHTFHAVIEDSEEEIEHARQGLQLVDAVLRNPTSTEGEKEAAQKHAKSLVEDVDSEIEYDQGLLGSIQYEPENKTETFSWYTQLATRQNILKALSVGLKAASVGIIGYGLYKSLSSSSVVASDARSVASATNVSGARATTIASAPVSSAIAIASRDGSLGGLTIHAPTHGGFFQEHKTIPTNYKGVYNSVLGARK